MIDSYTDIVRGTVTEMVMGQNVNDIPVSEPIPHRDLPLKPKDGGKYFKPTERGSRIEAAIDFVNNIYDAIKQKDYEFVGINGEGAAAYIDDDKWIKMLNAGMKAARAGKWDDAQEIIGELNDQLTSEADGEYV